MQDSVVNMIESTGLCWDPNKIQKFMVQFNPPGREIYAHEYVSIENKQHKFEIPEFGGCLDWSSKWQDIKLLVLS